MLVLTAKLNKKKAIIVALAAAAVILLLIWLLGGKGEEAMPAVTLMTVVKNNDERVDYLSSLGWQVEEEPIDSQTIVIPQQMNAVYESYNQIQQEQGFDLGTYGGLEATRYTYRVLNYPGADSSEMIVADIVVYRNEVIAGDVQSASMDGFMHGLVYPG